MFTVVKEIIDAQISLVKNYVMKLCQSTQGRKQTPPRGTGGEKGKKIPQSEPPGSIETFKIKQTNTNTYDISLR